MVIVVRTRNPIGPQIWSWPVIGVVVGIGIGAGIAFTTSEHPWIADAFYALSAVLLVVKFITWEDIRQQEPKRRRIANSLAAVAVVIILALVITGNHHLNAKGRNGSPNPASQASNYPGQSEVGKTEPKPPIASPQGSVTTQKPKQPATRNQARPSPPQSRMSPDTTEETNEATDAVKVKAQHHTPKDEVTAQVNKRQDTSAGTVPSPAITINNAPGGFAISGGNVSNPTVNNFSSPSRTIGSDFREPLRAVLAKQVATVRVHAVNDMEANEFAQQWYDLLAAAGWNMKDKQVILVQLERPWRGVRVGYRGQPLVDDKGMVTVPDKTPEAALVSALMTARVEGISVNPKPELEENFIELLVSSNPRHE